jgi:metal-responsive CopG/Arc/MetJ family transcriptional regulator
MSDDYEQLELMKLIDQAANELGITRSEFINRAVAEKLEREYPGYFK